jgi:hypothetical protein
LKKLTRLCSKKWHQKVILQVVDWITSCSSATNKLLPLFDQTGDYPMVEDTKQLPPDFTRILAMFAGAVGDAISEEVLNPEMAIQI